MNQEQRLQQKKSELQQQWNDLSQKIGALRKAVAVETRVEEKLRLQALITEAEADRENIEQKLIDVEKGVEGLFEASRGSHADRPIVINPFHYGGPVMPESFIGHRRAVDFCRTRLTAQRPTNIAISGERRIGKTSLLHYLHKFGIEETGGNLLCLYLDCGIFGRAFPLLAFWQEFIYLLQGKINPTSPLVTKIDNLENQPNLSYPDLRRFLRNYYQYYPNQPIVLLIDEFEQLFETYNQDTEELLRILRLLTQRPVHKLTLIIATRDPLSQVCQPFGLEFHGSFAPCYLEPFDEAEARHVVQTLLARSGVEFTEEELNYIWDISQRQSTGAHPIFVQVAASLIFEYKQNNPEPVDYHYIDRRFNQQTRLYKADIPSSAPERPTWIEPEQLPVSEEYIQSLKSKDHLRTLIHTNHQRLAILKEQQALHGSDTRPAILIEIEEIEAKLEELEAELKEIKD